MSEPGTDKERPDGTTLERSREEIIAAAKPLPADEYSLTEDLTDDEACIFLATILDA